MHNVSKTMKDIKNQNDFNQFTVLKVFTKLNDICISKYEAVGGA